MTRKGKVPTGLKGARVEGKKKGEKHNVSFCIAIPGVLKQLSILLDVAKRRKNVKIEMKKQG